jgi:transcriptional regulator with XRE-family HTH domain
METVRREPIDLSFAIWLSRQLRRHRVTQREVARRSGLNHSTISRILLGHREPSWGTVQRLALAVGYPPPNVLLGRFGVHARPDREGSERRVR